MPLLSNVKRVDVFPMLWVDETADIDEVTSLRELSLPPPTQQFVIPFYKANRSDACLDQRGNF